MSDFPPPARPERPEEFEHIPASPFAPHFIEKVLLAIIVANPRPAEEYKVKKAETLPAVRLQRAMKALFGLPVRRQPVNDLPELVRSAQRNLWDESTRQHEIKMEGKALTQTSINLSDMICAAGNTQTESLGRAEYARLLERSKEPEVFDYLHWVTNVVEHAEEKAIFADLQSVAEIFKRWNIDTELDPDKLGLHSLSQLWDVN